AKRSKKSSTALEPEILPKEETDDEEEIDSLAQNESGSSSAIQSLPAEIEEKDVGAISPHDPLRRYLEEVRRYPLLDPEEEFRLAMKLKNEGDMDAAKKLIQANLRLVVKI